MADDFYYDYDYDYDYGFNYGDYGFAPDLQSQYDAQDMQEGINSSNTDRGSTDLSGLMGMLRSLGVVNDAGRPTGGAAAGLGALIGLMNSRQSTPPPKGYTGGIPRYVATRQSLPLADVNRRPGSAGRRYFSDVSYAPPGQAPAAPAPTTLAAGGIASLNRGGEPRYLAGDTDGMADKLPASIEGEQPAALSHGEFVVPADVVSHIGNGNSEAGAKRLYSMMDRIRQARTGNSKQGKQINPDKYLPA